MDLKEKECNNPQASGKPEDQKLSHQKPHKDSMCHTQHSGQGQRDPPHLQTSSQNSAPGLI